MKAFSFLVSLAAALSMSGCGQSPTPVERSSAERIAPIGPTAAPMPTGVCAPNLSTEVCQGAPYGAQCRTITNNPGLCTKNGNNDGCSCLTP